jgi:uncharacterized integral membrane protein
MSEAGDYPRRTGHEGQRPEGQRLEFADVDPDGLIEPRGGFVEPRYAAVPADQDAIGPPGAAPPAAQPPGAAASGSTGPGSTPPPTTSVPRRVPRSRFGGAWVAVTIAAVILLLLLVFILENGRTVDVAYFGQHGHLPLGVALLLAAVFGVLVVAIPGYGRIIQLRRAATHPDRRTRPARNRLTRRSNHPR